MRNAPLGATIAREPGARVRADRLRSEMIAPLRPSVRCYTPRPPGDIGEEAADPSWGVMSPSPRALVALAAKEGGRAAERPWQPTKRRADSQGERSSRLAQGVRFEELLAHQPPARSVPHFHFDSKDDENKERKRQENRTATVRERPAGSFWLLAFGSWLLALG